mmetsp:Transcript_4110/g.17255  ORF Transcript_4110/g.17255 Transcript_4110/m.17255 type:complete len:298 (+) Transcript_4110:1142-2035(+)
MIRRNTIPGRSATSLATITSRAASAAAADTLEFDETTALPALPSSSSSPAACCSAAPPTASIRFIDRGTARKESGDWYEIRGSAKTMPMTPAMTLILTLVEIRTPTLLDPRTSSQRARIDSGSSGSAPPLPPVALAAEVPLLPEGPFAEPSVPWARAIALSASVGGRSSSQLGRLAIDARFRRRPMERALLGGSATDFVGRPPATRSASSAGAAPRGETPLPALLAIARALGVPGSVRRGGEAADGPAGAAKVVASKGCGGQSGWESLGRRTRREAVPRVSAGPSAAPSPVLSCLTC